MKWLPFIMVFFFPLSGYSDNSSVKEQVVFNKVIGAIHSGDSSNISEDEYDQVSMLISSGNVQWMELYPKLIKRPFLGMTSFQEGLNISMAYALTENPSEVLRFVNEDNVNYICGIPFIEPTQSEINTYYEKAKAKIMAVSGKNPWKNKCLFALDRMVTSGVASSDQ